MDIQRLSPLLIYVNLQVKDFYEKHPDHPKPHPEYIEWKAKITAEREEEARMVPDMAS